MLCLGNGKGQEYLVAYASMTEPLAWLNVSAGIKYPTCIQPSTPVISNFGHERQACQGCSSKQVGV